jgi:hypothetical protein
MEAKTLYEYGKEKKILGLESSTILVDTQNKMTANKQDAR